MSILSSASTCSTSRSSSAATSPVASFEHDLPRRHLRHVRLHDQRHRPWAPSAPPPAARLTMRHFKDGDGEIDPLSPGARLPSPSSRTSSSIAAPSITSSEAGGYVSVSTGQARRQANGGIPGSARRSPTSPWMPPPASAAELCVAACPNASAALFTGAKITHLGVLPQGEPERERRALAMAEAR